MDVHYRELDSRQWSKPAALLISEGIQADQGSYIIIDPEVINTLGGTKSSTIAPGTITGSDLLQSSIDPLQPAADFAATNWVTRGWTDPVASFATFQTEVRDWITNNFSKISYHVSGCIIFGCRNNSFRFYNSKYFFSLRKIYSRKYIWTYI